MKSILFAQKLHLSGMFNPMEEPIQLRSPCTTVRFVKLRLEIVKRFLLRLAVDHQSLSQITNVIERLQFRYAAGKHHRKERDENVCMFAKTQVCLAAQLHESACKEKSTSHTVPFTASVNQLKLQSMYQTDQNKTNEKSR